jgi:D-amino-acid dehydrogenase
MKRVVVIGAGVAGLCCARELQRRGVHPVVVDSGRPGGGCSAGNAGWITPSLSGPLPAPGTSRSALFGLLHRDSPLYIRPRAVPGLVSWLWRFHRSCNERDYLAGLRATARLALRSPPLYDELRADGIELELHSTGLLFLFREQRHADETRGDLAHYRDLGYREPERLRGEELRAAVEGIDAGVVEGLLVREERHVRPESLCAGIAAAIAAGGADLLTGSEVVSLATRDGRVTAAIDSTGAAIEGDAFLLASGARSGELARSLGVHLPMQAAKGYSLTLERPRIELEHPLYLGEARVGLSPFDGALRVAGTLELSGINEDLDARRVESIVRSTRRYLPAAAPNGSAARWMGMRPLLPDGLPALGRLRTWENAWVASGYGMLGITLAPSGARALVQAMLGDPPDVDLAAFDPARFE